MNKISESFNAGRYAAIDIGTVTARLLVADVSSTGKLTELCKKHAICNLGIGVDKTGLLETEAIERVCATVGDYVSTLGALQDEDLKPITLVAKATSASRDAKNSHVFVSALADLGVTLQVIPGNKEAELSFIGASSAFPGESVIVIDAGGGSTEIIAGHAGFAPAHAHSFDIGCRRVTERYFSADPPTRQSIAEAGCWIASEMKPYLHDVAEDGFADSRAVAVAGTATSIVSMREHMETYDSERVHGSIVSRADVDELLGSLASKTLEQRRQIVGLEPDRAPVIIAGVLILQQVMETFGTDTLTISERDILHGIVLDAALR